MPPRSSSDSTASAKRWSPPLPDHKVPAPGEAYAGTILGGNYADRPLLKRLNYLHAFLLIGTPLAALAGIVFAPRYDWRTMLFSVFYYAFSGLGITAGYHRLFAHCAYKARAPFRWLLMLMGTAAVEGSIKWWSRDHRAHHRYVDTPRDPYSVIYGFWYAHIGWMLVKQKPENIGKANVADLTADPMIRFQHRWYLPLMLIMAFGVPTLVCGLGWGDYWGGYFFAGAARLVFVHHSTFFVNSLAHWAGAATYTDGHTARNSFITALVTLGEGYHNFHHEFPSDYRNAIEWYQYDPTKVFIRVAAALGLAYDLRTFPQNEIDKGKLQMTEKALRDTAKRLEAAGGAKGGRTVAAKAAELERSIASLEAAKARINWGPDPASLPVWTPAELRARVKAGELLLVLDGFVLDPRQGGWLSQHPGGEGLIKARAGQDITHDFKTHAAPTADRAAEPAAGAGYYKHSNAAQNLAMTMRVARLQGYWEGH